MGSRLQASNVLVFLISPSSYSIFLVSESRCALCKVILHGEETQAVVPEFSVQPVSLKKL